MAKLFHRDNAPANASGFTLVEVLVAVAILSIALGAVLSAMGQAINVTSDLRDRTVALWVAEERANEHLLRREWPNPDTSEGTMQLGGREWKWVEKVTSVNAAVSKSATAELRRMEIEVSPPDSTYVLAKLTILFRQP